MDGLDKVVASRDQMHTMRRRCGGLPVDIRYMNYRELDGKFDKLFSVGMFEHVGAKNHTIHFDTVNELMKNGGLFLLHTIGGAESGLACAGATSPVMHTKMDISIGISDNSCKKILFYKY